MLTRVMFLQFPDDLEIQCEDEAKPAVEPPYRWRDWAAQSYGPSSVASERRTDITGDELLDFINQDECTQPSGKKGAGLFRYLRTLTSSDSPGVADPRDVIATVFKGVDNRMKSG